MTNAHIAPRLDACKTRVAETVAERLPDLVQVSESLHQYPETAWQEVRSARLLSNHLRARGFTVRNEFVGLPTSFHAVFGTGSTRVGLMAEYDALPNIGHACGHNLIAATSIGAAEALSELADDLDLTVEVFGTPAEEGGGGKIEMLDRGAFEGLDLALMAHPAPVDVARARPFAVAHLAVEFQGKAAHAASFPTEGRNAADAFVIAQVAIGLLRQQLPSTVRVHGIVTSGGEAPNAIPEVTRGRWYVRASSLSELDVVQKRVVACFQAGADAAACSLEITPESQPYSEFHTDERLLELYEANARTLGRDLRTSGPETGMCQASTDMGNVSRHVRAIHPYIGVGSYPVLNHQREFADFCVGETAERALSDGATALAWTVIDDVLT